MHVKLLLKTGTKQVSALAGSLVLHGLSSKQAVEAVKLLADKDISLELSGTLKELNATFNPYGIAVAPSD